MRSCTRALAVVLSVLVLACTACGGGAPHSQSADVLAINQPTPDPTLDAVVRDLPHALAGVPPTPTAQPALARPVVKQSVPAQSGVAQSKPAAAKPTPTPGVAIRANATPAKPAAPAASPVRH